MKRHFDVKLLSEFIKESIFYVILCIIFLIIIEVQSGPNIGNYNFQSDSYMPLAIAVVLLLGVVLCIKHQYVVKRFEKRLKLLQDEENLASADRLMLEIDCDDTYIAIANYEAKQTKDFEIRHPIIFNTFYLSMFINVFIAIMLSTFCLSGYMVHLCTINKYYGTNISSIFNNIFEGTISITLVACTFIAIISFLWANFKTVFRTIFFAIFTPIAVSLIFYIIAIFLKKYLIGFYVPLFSPFSMLEKVFTSLNDNNFNFILTMTITVIAFSSLLYILGGKIYSRNLAKTPYSSVQYFITYLVGLNCVGAVYTWNRSDNLFTLIAFSFIYSIIACFLAELFLLYKKFNLISFLKRYAVLFIILNILTIILRFDLIGFGYHFPKISSVKQVEIKMLSLENVDLSVDQVFVFSPEKTYTFKRKESIDAIRVMHQNIIPSANEFMKKCKNKEAIFDENNAIGKGINQPVFLFNIDYQLNNLSHLKREYTASYDYKKDPSLLMPLVKTAEFKDQFYNALYNEDENPLIIIRSTDKTSKNYSKLGHIKDDKVSSKKLKDALKADVEHNGLEFILYNNTQYKYTVQIVIMNKDKSILPINGHYYIPTFYTNTINYIDSHADMIFKQNKIGSNKPSQ